MATVRFRGEKTILEVTKQLDAFRKVPEEYVETSLIGGTLSVFSRILILILIYKEVSYYNGANLKFTFKPDVDLDAAVKMNVDVTVATPCIGLSGVDITDETRQDSFSYGTLKRESTWWELSPNQRDHFSRIQQINWFLREEYHSVADIIFTNMLQKNGDDHNNQIPERTEAPNKPYDACRLYGTLNINKVAGTLQIADGESNPLFGLFDIHWHGNGFRNINNNFSHRINTFSFGNHASQIIQPLEGDERYIGDSEMIQYFIEIVPTQMYNLFSTINTYQYSVKENLRPLDSHKNSYGVPGIYFKYDWAALKVVVQQDRDNLVQFIIRLCSIISGIVVLSGIINSLLLNLQKIYMNIFVVPKPYQKLTDLSPSNNAQVNSKPRPVLVTNNILVNASEIKNQNSTPITTVIANSPL